LWNDPLGQTTQTATNLCVGTYGLTVTDDLGCTDVLTTISVAACTKSMQADNTSVFPNPASSELTISFPQQVNKDITIEIYNGIGKCVSVDKSDIVNASLFKKDISSLSSGLYYIRISVSNKQYTRRLIIQR
jgi:hypothetical protein